MVKIRLKWKGQIYNDVEVDINSSAREFKKTVRNITGISERDQQLVAHGVWQGNLKDEADLSSLSLTDRQTIMLMSGGAVGASQSTSTKIQVTAAPAPPPPPQTPILPVAWAVAPLASSASVQPARNGTQARPATHYSPLPILIRSEEQYSFQVDPRLLKIAAPITMYLLAVGLALPMPVLLVNNDAVLWYRLGGAFCTAVALPMMGAYSDKDGRRYTALWCLGAAFFQYLVLGLNPDGGGFAFQLAHLVGPMSSGVIAMGFAAAADVIAEQRRGWGGSTLAAEFALLSAAAGLAFTLGPFLSARMMAVSATTVYWAVCCPLCGLGWFLAFKFWEETNPHTDQSFFTMGQLPFAQSAFQNQPAPLPASAQTFQQGANVHRLPLAAASGVPQQQMWPGYGSVGGMLAGTPNTRPTCCCCIPCIPGCLQVNPFVQSLALVQSQPALIWLLFPVISTSLLGALAGIWMPEIGSDLEDSDKTIVILLLAAVGVCLVLIQVFFVRLMVPKHFHDIQVVLVGLVGQSLILAIAGSLFQAFNSSEEDSLIKYFGVFLSMLVGTLTSVAEPCLYSSITMMVPHAQQGCLQCFLGGARALGIALGMFGYSYLAASPSTLLFLTGSFSFFGFITSCIIFRPEGIFGNSLH